MDSEDSQSHGRARPQTLVSFLNCNNDIDRPTQWFCLEFLKKKSRKVYLLFFSVRKF